MVNLWVIFLTGLTTGGLSCMAVQGGLLASTLTDKSGNGLRPRQAKTMITTFLLAKLLAYAVLGFLLGWLGTLLEITPTFRAVLQLAIGIFLLGTAGRLFNLHPFFRYFTIQPPSSVRRYLRRTAKAGDGSWLTPAVLGLFTVLIPCGVTQAMLLVALGTGRPIQAMAVMFAFTLGTVPVFFALTYAAARLGDRLQARFATALAVVILVLGLFTLEGGLNLIGSPVSYASFKQAWSRSVTSTAPLAQDGDQQEGAATPLPGTGEQPANRATVTVDDRSGYKPARLEARAGTPLTLTFKTEGSTSCARAVVFRSLGIQKVLPSTGEVEVTIPAQPAGSTLRYSCSMGMYRGTIVFR